MDRLRTPQGLSSSCVPSLEHLGVFFLSFPREGREYTFHPPPKVIVRGKVDQRLEWIYFVVSTPTLSFFDRLVFVVQIWQTAPGNGNVPPSHFSRTLRPPLLVINLGLSWTVPFSQTLGLLEHRPTLFHPWKVQMEPRSIMCFNGKEMSLFIFPADKDPCVSSGSSELHSSLPWRQQCEIADCILTNRHLLSSSR